MAWSRQGGSDLHCVLPKAVPGIDREVWVNFKVPPGATSVAGSSQCSFPVIRLALILTKKISPIPRHKRLTRMSEADKHFTRHAEGSHQKSAPDSALTSRKSRQSHHS
jgi:hypothetical protein